MVRPRVRLATPSVLQRFNLPGLIVAAVLVSTAIACVDKKSPASPTQTPPAPAATGLSIRGCAEAEGYQCRAFARYSDGKEEEVTAQVHWQPLATTAERLIATFDTNTRRVTPKFAGTITVTGQYYSPGVPDMTGKQTVDIMVPPILLNGSVENGSSKRKVVGARLAVASGPSAGTATTTDANGRWSLTIVPTLELSVEVSHPDYNPWTFDLSLTGDLSRSRDLSLYPLRPEPSPTPPPAPTPPPSPAPPAEITEEFTGDIGDSYSAYASLCSDPRGVTRTVPCRTFTLPPSPHRQITARLVWRNWEGGIHSEIELGVQVRQNAGPVWNSSNSVNTGTASIISEQIDANKAVEVRVLLLEGHGLAKFTLSTTRRAIY